MSSPTRYGSNESPHSNYTPPWSPQTMLAQHPGQLRVSSFPSGVFDCFDDAESFFLALCCPCCAHGVLCNDIEGKRYYFHCLMWLLCSPSCLPAAHVHHFCHHCFGMVCCKSMGLCPPLAPLLVGLSTYARIRLRDKYGLAGDTLTGALLFTFLPCAALCSCHAVFNSPVLTF
jgi:Cys-rich protein (TIGR01571 family)